MVWSVMGGVMVKNLVTFAARCAIGALSQAIS
jgi:hypothetical protein